MTPAIASVFPVSCLFRDIFLRAIMPKIKPTKTETQMITSQIVGLGSIGPTNVLSEKNKIIEPESPQLKTGRTQLQIASLLFIIYILSSF